MVYIVLDHMLTNYTEVVNLKKKKKKKKQFNGNLHKTKLVNEKNVIL